MTLDVRGLVTDPEFQKYSLEERIATLTKAGVDPKFIEEYRSLEPAEEKVEQYQEAPETSLIDKIKAGARQVMTTPVPTILDAPVRVASQGTFGAGDTIEGALEMAPAIGGGIGAVLGAGAFSLPGALAGASIGESGRQLIRRGVGLPQATGLVQRLLDLDPDSPEAAAAGVTAENAAGLAGAGAGKLLEMAGNATERSSLRSLLNILHPKTARDHADAMGLAARMKAEGIAPAWSSREAQVVNADRVLADATAQEAAMRAELVNQGATIPAQPIEERVINAIPKRLPDNTIPLRGQAQRKAAEDVAMDTLQVIDGRGDIPIDDAVGEKVRLDKVVEDYWETGRENVPGGIKYDVNAVNAWRDTIHKTFPNYGEAGLLRKSDMLNITRLLKQAAKVADEVGGLGSAAEEGNVIGAAAASRWSIPFMATAKAMINSGEVASFSSAAKSVIAHILHDGANSAQAWLRLSDVYGALVPPEGQDEGAIDELINSVSVRKEQTSPTIAPSPTATPAESKEDFIRRFQQ
jgi:hypothetical protein